jgi:hypothetical protein
VVSRQMRIAEMTGAGLKATATAVRILSKPDGQLDHPGRE